MRKFSKLPLLGLTVLAIASQAHADVSFHGYGQIVGGTVFSNNRTFPTESAGYNYHADPTFTPNSNFALQATAPLDNNISATAQILARGDNDFQPKFQWAYLKYQLNDTFALKVGRLQLPFYQFSDYQAVGEAYPWVVLPESVYFSDASTYDGLNLSVEQSIGDWYFYLQTVYGAFEKGTTNIVQAPGGGTVAVTENVKDHNLFGLSLDASYNDWLTLRAAAFASKISISGDGTAANPFTQVQGVVDLFNQAGYTDAAKALDTSNDPIMYYVASAQITRNNWMFITEYQGLQYIGNASGLSPCIASEYASLGYHFGKLLPLVTFGHRNQWMHANKVIAGLPAGSPLDVAVDAFSGNPGFRNKDYFYEATLRYDLTATVALKLDYTFYESHWKTTDYPVAASLAGATNPPDANRLLAAVTFSF